MSKDLHAPDPTVPSRRPTPTAAAEPPSVEPTPLESMTVPTRRDVVRGALLACGFTVAAGNVSLLTACSSSEPRAAEVTRTSFSTADVAWLDEVAETILPATETPGAKAAEVGAFIALMVTDTYSPEEQAEFRAYMEAVEQTCLERFGAGMVEASPEQRHELLAELDREQWQQQQDLASSDRADEDAEHPFRGIKWLTLLGYFTSEIGYTQAMRYRESPGRYQPCVEDDGGPAWARHA